MLPRLDNNVMHAKPDLRVFLKWMIAGSGSVITDDIPLKHPKMEREKHPFEVNLLPFLVGFQHVFKRTISTGDPKGDFEGACFSGFMVDIKNEWIFVTAGHCLKHLAKLLDSDLYEPHSFRFMEFLHCLLYTSPSPRDATLSRMPSSA